MGTVLQIPSQDTSLTIQNTKTTKETVAVAGANTVVFSKKLPVSIGTDYEIIVYDEDGIGIDTTSSVKSREGFTYDALSTGSWTYLVVRTI